MADVWTTEVIRMNNSFRLYCNFRCHLLSAREVKVQVVFTHIICRYFNDLTMMSILNIHSIFILHAVPKYSIECLLKNVL